MKRAFLAILQFIILVYACVSILYTWPNPGWNWLLFPLAIGWMGVLCYRCKKEKRYYLAAIIFILNGLVTCFTIKTFIWYDEHYSTKIQMNETDKDLLKDFGVLLAEYKQMCVPVIDSNPIRCSMYAAYACWFEHPAEKGTLSVWPSDIQYIFELPGKDMVDLFGFKKRKYCLLNYESSEISRVCDDEGIEKYITGAVYNASENTPLADTLVVYIASYSSIDSLKHENDYIDSMIFVKTKTFHSEIDMHTEGSVTIKRERTLIERFRDL